jgi:hypothetical protein
MVLFLDFGFFASVLEWFIRSPKARNFFNETKSTLTQHRFEWIIGKIGRWLSILWIRGRFLEPL